MGPVEKAIAKGIIFLGKKLAQALSNNNNGKPPASSSAAVLVKRVK